MPTLVRNGLIILACLAISLWAITPPESKLRKGKDLAGGASLVYAVDIKPSDPPDTMSKVASVIKERLDPKGVMEITVVPMGTDRLEITMPLPSDRVKELRAKFEETLKKVQTTTLTRDELERIAVLPEAERAKAIAGHAGGDAARQDKIEKAARDFANLAEARSALSRVDAEIRAAEDLLRSGGGAPTDAIKALQGKRNELIDRAAQAELAYEPSLKAALATGLNAGELRRVLQLSDRPVTKPRRDGTMVELGSPRGRALKEIDDRYPEQRGQVEAAVNAWKAYERERSSLDDPQDIVRILKGAGVLTFRIAPSPGELGEREAEARQQLRQGGPRAVKVEDVHWYKVNNVDAWVETAEDLEALKTSPTAYFQNRRLVADEYKGEYYILLWDRAGLRLDPAQDGDWSVASARQDADQLGRPAIAFTMDARGADRLGQLTGANTGKQMAVLLDDEVYTAPTLQSRISSSGQITGTFEPSQLNYVIRVLSAGSLKAKLSSEPVSVSILGPSLGKENLDKGLLAGIVAFVVVAAFMTAYYFACGFISILALILNALMLVAAMSLNQAAWSLPGIAGVILTFGMAVDANVLIYERMREEMTSGHDLRTAVRLGYAKALAAIVDGNITTLIVAVVLGFTGTQEIKGFALTLGIGTVTTLFAQLFGTRFLFNVLVEKLHWRRAGMLPMAMKWTLRPHIDWLGLRYVSYGVSAVFVLIGVAALFVQGEKLLGTEFRGGTAVTLQFKEERPATPTQPAKAVTLPRQTVVDRVTKEIPAAAPAGSPLQAFKYAEVIAVNPEEGGKSSGTYTIKTEVTDPDLVQKALVDKFSDVVSVRQAVTYAGAQGPAERSAFPVVSLLLGEVVDFPADKTPVSEYEGGVAVLLDKISPPVPKAELEARLATARAKPDYADIAARPFEVRVLAGSDQAVTAAAVLVRDPEVKYSADPRRWATDVRDREFNLVRSALTQTQTLAEVQNFSSAVASTFKAQAIVAVLISTLLVVIYVWVRFNSFRYSLAAIATTLHDCLVAIGFVGLANVLYERAPGLAHTLGILPFKIDLNVVAAVLTILGYSLNDTIIVMDRIRENRGKLPFATRAVINEAINQTVSRTIITAGTTFLATTVLYVMGGEGVRVFAYTMLVGIIVGTYSSISVAAPLVWSHAAEDSLRRRSQAGGDGAVARTAA